LQFFFDSSPTHAIDAALAGANIAARATVFQETPAAG